ncbi:BMP family ABC transporter substrate-binding protein [Virgibacillus sp. C22-A2]|uniref:BMP family ABC transporter substrate-binding protein n=1 Tax=Virgibacillus tibetensis TaxID=3042313 RepID=A0ABU6KEQ2_9BACI|nr:BMP family ABC transporter substrate-binding protein [Virgibacillus sp. C22-A2]
MKKLFVLLIGTLLLVTGCGNYFEGNQIQNVGMLMDGTIENQAWAEKGYNGLVQIGEDYDVDIFYKEEIITEQEISNAIEAFVQDGVNLIFGHSSIYGKYFVDLAELYPDVHFVYFNGGYFDENVTSLNFSAHAMGFFGGMVAGKMTSTNHVGIVSAYEWQPEIEGFYEGVKYQNSEAVVHMNFINDWNDTKTAGEMYEKLRDYDVDVFYPTGDSFTSDIIHRAKEDDLYAIGYVSDQSDTGDRTVLTSTIQHVDKLYEMTAKKFNKGQLEGTIMTFDFQEEAISLGEFSPDVPKYFQKLVNDAVDRYIETGLLPNE